VHQPSDKSRLALQVTIKFKAKGELQENGKREVFFETHGVPRVLEIPDTVTGGGAASKRVVREKSDGSDPGSVGAPMAGDILEARCTLVFCVVLCLWRLRLVC
jgi:pyruvate carboxylase